MLFQNGVLIDSLTVSENISLALQAAGHLSTEAEVKRYLELVKLDAADLHKMPGQLSGGMLRRAALAQLLSQRKRLIVLDEPFTGLDLDTANGIIQELLNVMREENTSFILISHQVDLAAKLNPIQTVVLRPAPSSQGNISPPCIDHLPFFNRTMAKVLDYFFISLPLIVLCFFAVGAAMGMLFGDALARTEVTDQIMEVMDEEAKNWPQMMRMFLDTAKEKTKELTDKYVPVLKAIIYASGMAHIITIEIGPLLTGLLLAGRIGGTYAGEVGTMQAGNQNRLLKTLGVSPLMWSLVPTVVAALIAAPLLTVVGSFTAIFTAGFVFEMYELGTQEYYWRRIYDVVFHATEHWQNYPPYVIMYRSVTFIVLIIVIAELCARTYPWLQPRHVPFVITSAVVLAGLAILFADWCFCYMLVQYGLASDGFELLESAKDF